MAYEEYSREEIWGSGKLTTDLLKINHKKLTENQKKFKIKKLGDIVACPIPDIVMEQRGFKKSYDYFSSLAKNYIKIKNIMRKENPRLLREWGKLEKRKEKPGKYFERMPKKYRLSKMVIGAGKYHEFLITRLLFVCKSLTPVLYLPDKRLSEIIKRSKSISDFHSKLMLEMIRSRLKQGSNAEECLAIFVSSMYHPGFTEQNNCFKEIRSQLKDLKKQARQQDLRKVVTLIEEGIKTKTTAGELYNAI